MGRVPEIRRITMKIRGETIYRVLFWCVFVFTAVSATVVYLLAQGTGTI